MTQLSCASVFQHLNAPACYRTDNLDLRVFVLFLDVVRESEGDLPNVVEHSKCAINFNPEADDLMIIHRSRLSDSYPLNRHFEFGLCIFQRARQTTLIAAVGGP